MKRQNTKEKIQKSRGSKAVYYTGFILVIILLVSGCAYPLNSGNTGSVSLVLPELNLDDLVDADDVQLPGRSADGVAGVTWTFSGTGPGGVTVSSVFTPSATLVTLTDLVTGSWTFNLEAKLGETLLAQGRAQTTLRSGENSIQMVVRGAMGLGATTVVPYEEIEIGLTMSEVDYIFAITLPESYNSIFWFLDDEVIEFVEGYFYTGNFDIYDSGTGVITINYVSESEATEQKKISVIVNANDKTYRGDVNAEFIGGGLGS